MLEDSDGDGIPDKNDLDDDNDGILDTEECGNVDKISVNKKGAFTETFTQEGTYRIQADYLTIDNSTRIEINGQNIVGGTGHNGANSTGILNAETGAALNSGDHLLLFPSNDNYDRHWEKNIHGLPRLRIIITESGVQMFGTRTPNDTTLEPLHIKDGTMVTDPNFSKGINTVVLEVPDGRGLDGAHVNFTMERDFCKDTDGDGIPNKDDLDSDNDGCPDAIEGTGNVESDQLNADNSINSGVDTDGVPTLVNGGQDVGDSQKATQIDIAEQPQNQNVCIGSNAKFLAKATAQSTEVFNGGTPDYTNATIEDVNYQWQKYNTAISAWEDILGQNGTENSGENITLDLGAQKNRDNSGTKYRVKLTSASMSCPEYSNEATLTVKELPNNTSTGFTGANICFGEAAKLTYDAEDASFTAPHTIVYKNKATGIQYSQVVNTSSAFEFTAGDAPTIAGLHKYEIISIADGNGCVRTSGFGKATAQIKIKGEVTCLITGDESPVCPKKTFTYSAPANMNSYAWSVTGNAIVQGATNMQDVNVLTGNSGSSFTLTVAVRSSDNCKKTCTKTVSVVDNTKPTFTKPTDVSLCVNNIINANFIETTKGDINTPPDYYEFPANYTDLDITNMSDNCCNTGNTITWTITPTSNGTTISGTGQPSATLLGKKLWLDIATSNPKSSYTEKTYTIIYKVTDCNGNESDVQSTTITVKPRPKINTN